MDKHTNCEKWQFVSLFLVLVTDLIFLTVRAGSLVQRWLEELASGLIALFLISERMRSLITTRNSTLCGILTDTFLKIRLRNFLSISSLLWGVLLLLLMYGYSHSFYTCLFEGCSNTIEKLSGFWCLNSPFLISFQRRRPVSCLVFCAP